MKRPLVGLAAVLAVLLWAAPRVRAEDPPANDPATQVKNLLADLDKAEKAKDEAAIQTLAKQVPPLYKGTQDPALRASLAAALGAVVKNAKLSAIPRKAAIAALVETGDGPTAWSKALSKAYPANDADDPEKVAAEIVKAVGVLHPDAAIDVLLDTFKKAKQPWLSAAAATALGGYHKSKKREMILEEMVKAGKNMVPAQSRTTSVSKEALDRWNEVAPALTGALDALTGDHVGDVQEWFKKVAEAKNNLKSLFKD